MIKLNNHRVAAASTTFMARNRAVWGSVTGIQPRGPHPDWKDMVHIFLIFPEDKTCVEFISDFLGQSLEFVFLEHQDFAFLNVSFCSVSVRIQNSKFILT